MQEINREHSAILSSDSRNPVCGCTLRETECNEGAGAKAVVVCTASAEMLDISAEEK